MCNRPLKPPSNFCTSLCVSFAFFIHVVYPSSPSPLISYFYESKTPSLSLNILGKKTGVKNRRTQILEFYSLFSHLPTPHSPFHFSFHEFRLCPTLECVCLIFGEVLCAFILFSKRVSLFLCLSLLHCRCSPGMSWMRIRDRFNSENPSWKGNKESLIELKSGTCLLQAWSLNQLECVRAPFTLYLDYGIFSKVISCREIWNCYNIRMIVAAKTTEKHLV